MASGNNRSYGYRNGDPDDDEDEEELDISGYKTQKDAVIFAIEVSHSMLQPSSESKIGDSATLAALKCAYQLMQQRIISNPADMMAILLFGTKRTNFSDEADGEVTGFYPNCYLLTDLGVPSASDVRNLRDIVQSEEVAEILDAADNQVPIGSVLFCANQVFATKAPNFTSRRLFFVTDKDNPHSNDKALRDSAVTRAKDLFDLGVSIELFPISQPNHNFDRSRFYDNIIYRGLSSDPDAPAPVVAVTKAMKSGSGISLLQSLISSVNSKATPHRSYFNLPLEIGSNLRIGVKGYMMIKRQKPAKSCWIWVGGDKLLIASVSTMQIEENTARKIENNEIRRAYEFGGQLIEFTTEEINTIRNFGDPCIRIIGFKSIRALPEWANCREPVFLYPDEADYVGSTRVFAALHHKLLSSQKYGLAWVQKRKNTSPVLAALLPGAEDLDEEGNQNTPAGLWLITLPFADDIRSKPEAVQVRAPDHLVDKMKEIMNLLRLPKNIYDAGKYPNPSLQWFYRILQALALEDDIPNDPEDKTLPRTRQIHKRAGSKILEWIEALELGFTQWKGSNQSAFFSSGLPKRAQTNISERPSKKPRLAKDLGDDEIRNHYNSDTLNKFTITDMTAWLKSKNIVAHGKKDDIISQIETYFSSR